MAQKGHKQEGMSCGEVCAVCGGYSTISLHLAASASCAIHCTYDHIQLLVCSYSYAISTHDQLQIAPQG